MKTNGNSVQIVRKSTGLSQPKFAELIGVSAPAIASIETDRLKVSPELADRISIATGVDPETISGPWETPRYLNDNSEYSPESYKDWKAQTATSFRGNSSAGEIDFEMLDKARDFLGVLLGAAGERNRFTAVAYRFHKWQEQMIADYGLEKQFEAGLKKLSGGELRRKPLFQRSHAGLRKIGITRTSMVHNRKMTPALQKVAAAIRKQTEAANSAKKVGQ